MLKQPQTFTTLQTPFSLFLVTADVVGPYPSITPNEGQEVPIKKLDNFNEKSVPTENLVNMAEFVIKNNYFGFRSNVKH